MRIRLLAMMLGLVACSNANLATAALLDVRATPRQANVVGTAGNLVSIRWAVATSPDHASGVTSTGADIIDPSSGAILQRVAVLLNAGGGGPFVLRDVINLDAATVGAWVDAGLRRVVLQRSFADPATGAFINASIVLNLSASRLRATREAAPGELAVASLQLEFDNGTNARIVGRAEALQAILTVQHTGSGMLRGRWQIAEPGSSEGVPLYRTLALVNANVRAAQRSIYVSPNLPTGQPGVYALRFCVTESQESGVSDDVLCPDADRIVSATYQVQEYEDEPAAVIRGLAPDRAVASGDSLFRWQQVPAATLYQLQVFEPAAGSSDAVTANALAGQPRFVTGMLVRGAAAETPLSALVLSKLRAGQRYLWRITAHDETGRTLGSSAEATFVFNPGAAAPDSSDHDKKP
jgi:hypothetical protein